MRIAFLNIYQGMVFRGAERSTHELANRLSKKHHVWVIQGGAKLKGSQYNSYIIKTDFSDFDDTDSSIWRKLYLDQCSLRILSFTLRSLPFLRQKGFDLIIPINGGWQTLICRLFAFLTGVKMVIIGRAGIGRDDHWNLIFCPDRFVALTKKAYFWAKRVNPKVKVEYIPNAIDMKKFNPDGAKVKISLKRPVVLCVGALTANKRIDSTIKAVAKLNDFSLLVLGNGHLKNSIQKLGVRLLGKKRFLLTNVDFEQMPKFYRSVNIFTLVSEGGEAFGNVYLEALASGLPVVATDDETRKEILGSTGIFVNPCNLKQYAQALEKALQKKDKNEYRKQATQFSWEKVITKYEKVLSSL